MKSREGMILAVMNATVAFITARIIASLECILQKLLMKFTHWTNKYNPFIYD